MKKIAYTLLLLAVSLAVTAQDDHTRMMREMEKLMRAKAFIEAFYVDSVDCGKLTEDAIRGMLKELDPHSTYTNAEETRKMNEPLQGNFEGIGVQFDVVEDTMVVIKAISGGPSEKMGIMQGDRIVMCNDTVMAGVKMSRDNMVKLLRGPRGSLARLGVKRGDDKELVFFDVIREKIPIHTVDAVYMIRPGVGYIRLESFGNTTTDEVGTAIDSLKRLGMTSLIFDLQQNGGGYLNQAASVASLFLDKGQLIVYTRGRSVPDEEYEAIWQPESRRFTGPLVVLVDEYTASSAEIVSGAVQDYDRGTIVGRRTYGKGLVQRPCFLPDGSMVRLTISHYYTPTGRCIQKPYEKGHGDDYAKDLEHRLKSGELTCRDSIHFADSLRYQTLVKGRTVYGGGGIMPDVFVPLDTTRYSKYHRALVAKNCIVASTIKYMNRNRARLHAIYKDVEDFERAYEVEDEMWALLEAEAEKAKVKPTDEDEREAARPYMARHLKAMIARDLWDLSAYFRIWNEESDIIKAALKELGI